MYNFTLKIFVYLNLCYQQITLVGKELKDKSLLKAILNYY